jgi:hypothetical protein
MRHIDECQNRASFANLQARRDVPVKCAVCGRTVKRASRQQKFCSVRCRQRDAYAQKVRRGVIFESPARYTGNATNPPKKSNGFNGLQWAKSGSNPRIFAPRSVIEAELLTGYAWTAVVSPDGVTCMVASQSRRRPRA